MLSIIIEPTGRLASLFLRIARRPKAAMAIKEADAGSGTASTSRNEAVEPLATKRSRPAGIPVPSANRPEISYSL